MKDKVVNARISQELYDKLSKKAKVHRTTISHLIRMVVEDTLEIYDDVANIIDDKVKDFLSQDNILGFQSFVTSKEIACTACEEIIQKGEMANLIIFQNKTTFNKVVCENCKLKLEKELNEQNETAANNN